MYDFFIFSIKNMNFSCQKIKKKHFYNVNLNKSLFSTCKNKSMHQLILKQELSKNKIDALISFLKSWGVDAEITSTKITTKEKKQNVDFSLNTSIWKDREIDSSELRKQAWNRR
jgi:hypothetical protein